MFGWFKRRKHLPSYEGDIVPLTAMRPGQRGLIVDVTGGRKLGERLAALGVRPGRKITKVSSMLLGGPVTVEVDRSQIAIGHHMAARILVDVSIK
jgi:ferrous iron transport protein A